MAQALAGLQGRRIETSVAARGRHRSGRPRALPRADGPWRLEQKSRSTPGPRSQRVAARSPRAPGRLEVLRPGLRPRRRGPADHPGGVRHPARAVRLRQDDVAAHRGRARSPRQRRRRGDLRAHSPPRHPPERRPVNYVFQHYALFPHLDVADNIRFGLKVARTPREEATERVETAISMVQLEGLEARRVDQLSGGQQQRVALARAIVESARRSCCSRRAAGCARPEAAQGDATGTPSPAPATGRAPSST